MLAKRKSAGGSGSRQEVFAIKAVSQENVCHDLPEYWSIVEKLVFICAVGHQLLVQLYSFFETKIIWLYSRKAIEAGLSLGLVVLTGASQAYRISFFWLMHHPSQLDELQVIMMLTQSHKALCINTAGTTSLLESWCCQPELRQELVLATQWICLIFLPSHLIQAWT